MCNYVWVCFDCRTAGRYPALAKDVRCATCQKPCECLGTKLAIPPKSKAKQWESLRQLIHQARVERLTAAEKRRVRHLHNLEQRIAKLAAMPANPGRSREVTELRRKLDRARG